MKLKFSIIIPVYNTEMYLRKCLDSVKNQTYKNYEVIIINDGSTDNSLDIINEYTKDKRFKVYNKKNSGLSNTRNYALKYVTGDYICFLDSDDYYDPNILQEVSKLKYEYDIIQWKTTLVTPEGKTIRKENNTLESKKIEIDELKHVEHLETVGLKCFKTDFYLKNKFKFEPNKNFEDYGLIPLCYAKAKKIYNLDYYGHYYVQRNNGIIASTSGNKRMETLLYHYNNLIKKIDKDKDILEHKKKVIKSIISEKLIYSTCYVSLSETNKYVNLVRETNAVENINKNKFKKTFIKYCPTFYALINKFKETLKKINPQILLMIYIILNIIYMSVGSFKIYDYRTTIDTYVIGFYNFQFINCLIIVFLILKKKYKYKAIDIFLFLAVVFGIIATIFAEDMQVSIYGYGDRREGLLHICYYISLVILSSFIEKEKFKKPIIYTILVTGIFQLITGFTQVLYLFEDLGIIQKRVEQAFGAITNPNFYGTYMLLCLTLSIGLLLTEKTKSKKTIYFNLSMLFSSGVLISNALSSILAYILILCAVVIYYCFKKKFKTIFVLIISFVVPLTLLTKFDLTYAISDLVKTKDEVVEISKGNMDDSFGTDRMYLWKNTLKIVPDHIWNGAGVDNFAYAFNGESLPVTYSDEIIYDKAHNEYLQILVTQGIFALICWLTIYLLIIKDGLINFFKDKYVYLIVPIAAYLIQAFFNISVIEVAPIFYIILGLCINRENCKILK